MRSNPIAYALLLVLGFAVTLGVGTASASKQVVDYFGTSNGSGTLGGQFTYPSGVAVNNSGAGPAERGEIYVVDSENNRIQRFARNGNGTPVDPTDDSYEFISAWGAGVDAAAGGSGYQICTVASQCTAGAPSGIGGALSSPSAVTVDQDTGDLYVSDAGNNRINMYSGDGTFLRSLGYDVVASGPDKASGPSERQQLTIKADGGKFSLSFRGRATAPRGTGWRQKNSILLTLVNPTEGTFAVGQGISGSFIPPGTTIVGVESGVIKLSQPATDATTPSEPIFAETLPPSASAAEVETALNALPSIGGVGGSVTVSGGPGDPTGSAPYTIEFGGSLAGEALPPIVATHEGLTLGSGAGSAAVSTLQEGGAYEVCNAAAGDVCKAGGGGSGIGQVGETTGLLTPPAKGIAVSQPDGNPATGTIFLADTGNHRINSYDLDGSSPSAFGASTFSAGRPGGIAVDSRGIVYASNRILLGGEKREGAIERYDSENANGGGVGFLAPIKIQDGFSDLTPALTVVPDSDGSGSETDVLYALFEGGSGTVVKQFGPVNAPGLTTPPSAVDDEHGTLTEVSEARGVAVDELDGRIYLTSSRGVGQAAHGVYVLDNPSPPPTASLDSFSDISTSSVTAHATINPNGPPALSYHFEYSTDGSNWESTRSVVLGSQKTPQSIADPITPPGGFEPGVTYHVRLVAKRPLLAAVVTPELTFTAPLAAPLVETTGSPVRTATSARLDSRVDPNGSATTYYFEYGADGPCDANPCTSTEAQAAGSGQGTELVSQQLSGLQANTTYHYRVIADNGNPGSPVSGGDMTVTTRASDEPLSHGHLPGPVGSDRAWEQVNMPDTGGNPVAEVIILARDGERALFRIAGGTPDSNTGSRFALFFSERTSSGWDPRQITPARSQLRGGDWEQSIGTPDLSSIISTNTDYTTGEAGVWRLDPAGQPSKLFQRSLSQAYDFTLGLSADGSRALAVLRGEVDPAYPAIGRNNLYDVSLSIPHLVSVMPGGGPCEKEEGIGRINETVPLQSSGWVTADGSRVFFYCGNGLYLRNIEAAETKLISGPPLSGPACQATFIKSVAGAAFIETSSRLEAADTAPANCESGNGDIYRYEFGNGAIKCVTCVVPNGDVNVGTAVVSADGSRLYFTNSGRLLPGAPSAGGTYGLDVASGELTYVGSNNIKAPETTPDGSVLIFDSGAAGWNARGGQDNAGTIQSYRYDARDRSLVCVSCPADGSAPSGSSVIGSYSRRQDPAISADGNVLAFSTPTPLATADQNTSAQKPESGTDVYEWRDGRQLLVTDGLTNWTSPPSVKGVSASGRDIFFFAAAQYTPDALDAYQRLYDARIGGGFEFPKPPPPCPLEVCQGTPKGAPEERAPGTGTFEGPGNATTPSKRHGKKKHHRKRRHHAKKSQHRTKKSSQRANDNRRTSR